MPNTFHSFALLLRHQGVVVPLAFVAVEGYCQDFSRGLTENELRFFIASKLKLTLILTLFLFQNLIDRTEHMLHFLDPTESQL